MISNATKLIVSPQLSSLTIPEDQMVTVQEEIITTGDSEALPPINEPVLEEVMDEGEFWARCFECELFFIKVVKIFVSLLITVINCFDHTITLFSFCVTKYKHLI